MTSLRIGVRCAIAALPLALLLPVATATALADDPLARSVVPTTTQWEELSARIAQQLSEATAAAESNRLAPAQRAAIVDGVLAEVNFAAVDLATIRTHWNMISSGPEAAAATRARLTELATSPDRDGAEAAITLAQTVRRASPTDRGNAMRVVFAHPQLSAALADDIANTAPLAAMVTALPEADRPAAVEAVLGWSSLFTPQVEPAKLVAALGYVTALRDLGAAVPAERFQATRVAMIGVLSSAIESGKPGETEMASLQTAVRRLDSAVMRGELIGGSAPTLEFTWLRDRSGTPDWKSLADLRGKVVVLDYWATWCGPCIASFPQIAELRERYSADELVIIGVTSLQGAHYPRGRERIDTKGNPERELELMAEYMEEMGITWTVAFTTEPVFNPEYDVRGIPHLTIIDADGKVRHNGLHPAMPMDKKAELIDPLLKEATRRDG